MGDNKQLPNEIITTEILPRLPSKTLIRFKSVSKQWKTLISHPQFAQLHLHFQTLISNQCLFINYDNFLTFNWSNFTSKFQNNNFSSSRVQLGHKLTQLIQFSFDYAEGIFIVGSCNGLICLDFGFQLRLSDYLFIWNPSIRLLRSIRNPSVKNVKNLSDILDPPKFRNHVFICGFGYVAKVDDYKVVYVTEQKGSGRVRGYVFRLKIGSWKKMRVFDGYSIVDTLNCSGLLIDENLVWRVAKGVNKTMCVIGFDLCDEVLKEVDVPEWIECVENISICSLGRCLCVFRNDDVSGKVEVSMLKEYGKWDSWVKVFSFGCQHLCRHHYFGLTENEKYVVHIDGEYIRLLDLNQNPPTSNKVLRIGMAEDVVDYVESVISPFSYGEAEE